jgi:dTDP-4-dehydrorhamnose reductase
MFIEAARKALIVSDRERLRYCVIGGEGVIGAALVHDLRCGGVNVTWSTRRKPTNAKQEFFLDLADPCLPPLPQADVVLLTASVTRIADCRSDPLNTWRVNVEAQARIAEAALAKKAFVVFLSTTHVFDGSRAFPKPEDPCSPCSVYGQQKAEAESALLVLGNELAVVRLGKVIGRHLALFENWRRDLLRGETITAFDDLVMAPIAIAKIVTGLKELGSKRASGIWHLCGREDLSYFDAAEHLACRLGARASLVRRASAVKAGITIDERPTHSALAPGGIEEIAGVKIGDARAELDLGLELTQDF